MSENYELVGKKQIKAKISLLLTEEGGHRTSSPGNS